MLKASLVVAAAAVMIGCGGNAATSSNSNANSTNSRLQPVSNAANNSTPTNSTANTAANAATNANKAANAAAAKPAADGPQRISFASGKSDGAVDVTLAPGASKQFVIGAKVGQIFMVDTDDTDTKISMVKGKVAKDATLEEPGHYDTTLLENGDYIFEVKNTAKEELKTTVRVIISGGK
jgi:hypothetical protein